MPVEDPSYWDDIPFAPAPLPFRGKVWKGLTDLICLLGMTATRTARVFRTERNPIVPRKILVIRRGGLGDMLMVTPLLRALRKHFPETRVYILTNRQALAGLAGCSSVDQTFEIPANKKAWLSLLYTLRRERIDTALVLHRFFTPSLLTLCAGIPQRLGFSWKNHGFALTGSIPFNPARSQTLQIGQVLKLLGKPAADTKMEFRVTGDAVRCARDVLKGWGFDPGKRLVGIHPGGGETAGYSDYAKRWSPERFGRLADLLAQTGGVQVVLFEGPGDEPFVGEALRNIRSRVLGVASGLPLAVFAALLGQCDLVVVNDTGPMHIAAAQNVPVVAIIGPTHPAYTPPRGGMHKVIWAGVPCSPCYNPEETIYGATSNGKKVFKCWRTTHECMSAITAEEVCDVVVRQIAVRENEPVCGPGQSRVELTPNSLLDGSSSLHGK